MAMLGRMAGSLGWGLSGRWLGRNLSSSSSKVAMVLSGCGVYDGSEVHEASACLVHLSRHGAEVSMFAPDAAQMHVVNHLTGQPVEGETRNVLVESARIARGAISPLSQLEVNQFAALVFPGGFGAAKNLSSYAVEGEGMDVVPEVEEVLKEFQTAGKPIGLCCISPVLAARLFPGVQVTVGDDGDPAATAIRSMGATHVPKPVNEAHVDQTKLVVTTPAYMCEAPLHHIFEGIGEMIDNVFKLIK